MNCLKKNDLFNVDVFKVFVYKCDYTKCISTAILIKFLFLKIPKEMQHNYENTSLYLPLCFHLSSFLVDLFISTPPQSRSFRSVWAHFACKFI